MKVYTSNIEAVLHFYFFSIITIIWLKKYSDLKMLDRPFKTKQKKAGLLQSL